MPVTSGTEKHRDKPVFQLCVAGIDSQTWPFAPGFVLSAIPRAVFGRWTRGEGSHAERFITKN